jgi:hypothetical protein
VTPPSRIEELIHRKVAAFRDAWGTHLMDCHDDGDHGHLIRDIDVLTLEILDLTE